MPPLRTWKDIIDLLRSRGAAPSRQRGSHQTWTLPCGATFVVCTTRIRRRAPPHVRSQLRRLFTVAEQRGGTQ